jgi:hypothetical protein
MNNLKVGGSVRVTAGIPSFESCTGRIISIIEPVVTSADRKEEALMEMPLYCVRFDDGRRFRFRGRDLRSLGPLARRRALSAAPQLQTPSKFQPTELGKLLNSD